jgi:signal transduction histidine kinase
MKNLIHLTSIDELRKKAEEDLKNHKINDEFTVERVNASRLIHELSVHQIQLKLQNEELAKAVSLANGLMQKYKELHDFAPIGYIMLDDAGIIKETNIIATSILGKVEKYVVEHKFVDLLCQSEKIIFNTFFAELYKNYAKQSCDVCFKVEGGKIVYIQIQGVAFQSDNSCLLAVIDNTEKVIAQQKIVEYSKELEISDNAKDKFLSIIAHDLRSPFHTLLNFTDILVTDYESLTEPEKIEMISTLHNTVSRQYELLSDLLNWATMHKKGFILKKEELLFSSIINEQFDNVKIKADEKKIKLINNVRKSFIVFADHEMIKLILRNLISNSLKFSYNNGKIIISASESENSSEIIIEDFGIGISEEIMPKLFRIDVRISSAGTANEKGTGLGLNLIKEMIERLEGSLDLISKPGEGTKVIIKLPLK